MILGLGLGKSADARKQLDGLLKRGASNVILDLRATAGVNEQEAVELAVKNLEKSRDAKLKRIVEGAVSQALEKFRAGQDAAPEGRLLAAETLDVVEREIAKLPANQAVVVTMRDIEGFDADEVCNALDISETNQRVLLHRARTKLRRALEEYME